MVVEWSRAVNEWSLSGRLMGIEWSLSDHWMVIAWSLKGREWSIHGHWIVTGWSAGGRGVVSGWPLDGHCMAIACMVIAWSSRGQWMAV
eukprot:1133764-Lingulodinium_polyedra.AAC.1